MQFRLWRAAAFVSSPIQLLLKRCRRRRLHHNWPWYSCIGLSARAAAAVNDSCISGSCASAVYLFDEPVVWLLKRKLHLYDLLWICCKWRQGGLIVSRPTAIFRQQAGDLMTGIRTFPLDISPQTFPRPDNPPPFYAAYDISPFHYHHAPIYNIKRSIDTANVCKTDRVMSMG